MEKMVKGVPTFWAKPYRRYAVKGYKTVVVLPPVARELGRKTHIKVKWSGVCFAASFEP